MTIVHSLFVLGRLADAAHAQDVVVEDFEGPTLSWVGDGDIGAPAVPWDGQAVRLYAFYVYGAIVESDPVVITHHTLSLWTSSESYPVTGYQFVLVQLEDQDGQQLGQATVDMYPSYASWSRDDVDVGAGCGSNGRIVISGFATSYFQSTDTWTDDITLTGALCDGFVDLDGDGTCPQGTDLDGDGTCVQLGEPAPPGTVVDADEDPAPQTGGTGSAGGPGTGDTGGPPIDTGPPATGGTGSADDTSAPAPTGHTGGSTTPTGDTGGSTTPTGGTGGSTTPTGGSTSPTGGTGATGGTPSPTAGGSDPGSALADTATSPPGCRCDAAGGRAGWPLAVIALRLARRRRPGRP